LSEAEAFALFYAHVSDERKREAAVRIGEALLGLR
jgi:hypothetical protein